jgi:predicted GNAT family acetyltransferase
MMMKTFSQFLLEAKAKSPKPDALETIQKNTKRATPGMKYVVHTTSSDDIRVDNIEVPENQRGKGIATRRLKGLGNYADKTGKNISLTPVAKPGYDEKLTKMYQGLGYQTRTSSDKIAGADTMIRKPKAKR